MSKRFCTYMSDSNDLTDRPIRFIVEGQSLPDDWSEYVWQYAKDGDEAVSQHVEKHDLWQKDRVEKHTY